MNNENLTNQEIKIDNFYLDVDNNENNNINNNVNNFNNELNNIEPVINNVNNIEEPTITYENNINSQETNVIEPVINEVNNIEEPTITYENNINNNQETNVIEPVINEVNNIEEPAITYENNINSQETNVIEPVINEVNNIEEPAITYENNINSQETNVIEPVINEVNNIEEPTITYENNINTENNNLDIVEESDEILVNNQIQETTSIESIKDNNIIQNPTINKNTDNNIVIDKNTVNNNETIHPLLDKYAENLSKKVYVTNPAIGRDDEIRQLVLILLTPEKSGILVGKPGIGKTAIVEGLGYQILNNNVPEALKGYSIYKVNTASLLGNMPNTNEPKISVLLQEINSNEKIILFIDEIHTLMGTGGDSLDFANIFKPGLDRGNIKIIGATTTEEYERYVLRDKAFVRRFQKIDVLEPSREHTIKILMGTMPKFEKKMNVKMSYTPFIQEKVMAFIVDLTSEYRRVYEYSVRYPDIALTILQQAFSYALFDNKEYVTIRDFKTAIKNTNLVYPDVIKKELIRFNQEFYDIYKMETKQRLKEDNNE